MMAEEHGRSAMSGDPALREQLEAMRVRAESYYAADSSDQTARDYWRGYGDAVEFVRQAAVLTGAASRASEELETVRAVLNADLKAAQERVLTLELENQRLQTGAASREARAEPPTCVIGVYCRDHGFIHGAEAEELRSRIEACIQSRFSKEDIQRVLDDVDARDSVAWLDRRAAVGREPSERPAQKCTCWLSTDATFGSSEARINCAVHGEAGAPPPMRTP